MTLRESDRAMPSITVCDAIARALVVNLAAGDLLVVAPAQLSADEVAVALHRIAAGQFRAGQLIAAHVERVDTTQKEQSHHG